MKQGKELVELAVELQRQAESKRDFVADTRQIEVVTVNRIPNIILKGLEEMFEPNSHCHGQLAQRVQIPQKYYDRMKDSAPDLLAVNLNHWFRANPEKRMVRTLDGRARAFLSDKYRPLDNFDLAEAALPMIKEFGCEVKSCEVTETRFYIKAVTEKIQAEVKVGDIVQAGIAITNSEVGAGSLKVEPLVYRLKCRNGMICADYGMKKYHIGGIGARDFEGAAEFFRTETRIADDKAFFLKVQDTVRGALDKVTFEQIVDKFREAAQQTFNTDPVQVVEEVAKRFTLSDTERGSVLNHLIREGDLSKWGLANAVTRTSQDIESYDRATEFETLGSTIIELPKKEWSALIAA